MPLRTDRRERRWAVVLICTKAVESVVDTLAPAPSARMAGEGLYGGYSRPLVDTWDEE